jgi:hypothetical protein
MSQKVLERNPVRLGSGVPLLGTLIQDSEYGKCIQCEDISSMDQRSEEIFERNLSREYPACSPFGKRWEPLSVSSRVSQQSTVIDIRDTPKPILGLLRSH